MATQFDFEKPDEQMFPVLNDVQINAIRGYGREIKLSAGHELYSRGDRGIDFFVVLDGAVDAFEIGVSAEHHIFHTHRHGSFLGEINLFNNRKSLVSTVTSEDSRLLKISRLDFRRMLSAEPEIAKIILRTSIIRRRAFIRAGLAGATLIGAPEDPNTLRIRRFLIANDYPHQFLTPDAQDDQGRPILEILGVDESKLPVVWNAKGHALYNPCLTVLAYELGLLEEPVNGQVFDVVIVGAGPAGLAASVYAGSEGLDAVVIEAWAPGGQAGTSSQIENYLGFPDGISGWELSARAQVQAQKFGVQLAVARTVTNIDQCDKSILRVFMGEKTFFSTRSVVVASGAQYRKLNLPDYDRFEGRGIQYAATAMEAQLCAGQEIAIVGGGNSAGQAAVFLSQNVTKVHLLVRGKNLATTMSRYLINRIEASPKIQIHYETEIYRMHGEQSLEWVEFKNNSSGQIFEKPIRNLFVMIGAVPNTEWLRSCIDLDEKGFVITGRLSADSPYQTSAPGVFAIGDVRSGSVKRVASAVGEGSVVVSSIIKYLGASRQPSLARSEQSPAL